MKNKWLATIISTLFCLSFAVHATTQISQPTHIEYVTSWENGSVLVSAEKETFNPANCSFTGEYVIPWTASDLPKSLVLAAKASRYKVAFKIDTNTCFNNRPLVAAVRLANY